ncbi:ABC-three component system protein [Rhizobium leguminosarum]|uniref:ABC-three component system protein n=1 Tax=Rhizobium leguminosarum TaxID=384 RepID=UPI001C96A871|nr:ABC-three component system protein [Rhizobium leguminosarum]
MDAFTNSTVAGSLPSNNSVAPRVENEKKSDFDLFFDFNFKDLNKTDFEKWFAAMAECVFGVDFELVKAGGKKGDKKSDGRRISTETVYQCYAPESPDKFANYAATKISDSFPAVLGFWPQMKEWVFIHNNEDGLPTSASDKLEELRKLYPSLTISTGSRRFLKDQLHDRLSLQQMADLYPKAAIDVEGVQMEHVRPLLKRIISERGKHFGSLEFGEIPDEAKVEFNHLSEASKFDIKRARTNVDVVSRFLDGQNNPSNVSVIQTAMREKYLQLVGLGYEPDSWKALRICSDWRHFSGSCRLAYHRDLLLRLMRCF